MSEKILKTKPATDKDFPYVWRVYCDAVKHYIEPKLKDGWSDSVEVERFRKTWKAGDSHIITVDGEAIGWCGAKISSNNVHIDHLYIEPSHRGKGYGSRLVSEMITVWKKEGKSVHAPVMKDKRLIAATSRLGFTPQKDEGDSPLVQAMVYQAK